VSDNEKKLVKRILSGDEKAFEELFDALHSQVYNICLGFMKNPQDAKDMAQETFIKIYQKLHTVSVHE
jgi:DNA-directed RNA polymerase specialized sigma24 family protein